MAASGALSSLYEPCHNVTLATGASSQLAGKRAQWERALLLPGPGFDPYVPKGQKTCDPHLQLDSPTYLFAIIVHLIYQIKKSGRMSAQHWATQEAWADHFWSFFSWSPWAKCCEWRDLFKHIPDKETFMKENYLPQSQHGEDPLIFWRPDTVPFIPANRASNGD